MVWLTQAGISSLILVLLWAGKPENPWNFLMEASKSVEFLMESLKICGIF